MEQEASEAKESTAVPQEEKGKEKKKQKKQKDDKPKTRKTRRHFREEAKQAHAQTDNAPEAMEAKPEAEKAELIRSDSATTSLSPSAIVEMFHLQDDEYSSSLSTSVATTARYLAENETTGDFYQVKTRQRKQHSPSLSEHGSGRHRRSSLAKAQQKIRDGSTKSESWAILLRDGEKAAVVMVLGIVAGMCWMDALNLPSRSSSGGMGRFLCAYSAGANRSRQNLFILFKYPSLRTALWVGSGGSFSLELSVLTSLHQAVCRNLLVCS